MRMSCSLWRPQTRLIRSSWTDVRPFAVDVLGKAHFAWSNTCEPWGNVHVTSASARETYGNVFETWGNWLKACGNAT